MPSAHVQNHVIAADCLERNRHRHRRQERNVLDDAVLGLGDNAVGDGEHRRAVAIPVPVDQRVAVERAAVGAELDPVGGEALADPSLAVERHRAPAMA